MTKVGPAACACMFLCVCVCVYVRAQPVANGVQRMGGGDCASLSAGHAQKPGQRWTRSPEGSSASYPPPPHYSCLLPSSPPFIPLSQKHRRTQRHKQGNAHCHIHIVAHIAAGASLSRCPIKTRLRLTFPIQTTRS